MSRQSLIKLLQGYNLQYPMESDTVERFIDFVSHYNDCFERTQLSGHVTGSAWLTNSTGTHVLLTHHRKLDRWLQLGGHADGDSDTLNVALREAKEESGIENLIAIDRGIFDVDIHEIPARKNEPRHYHYDVRYALKTTSSEDYKISSESKALDWVEVDRLADRTTECSMQRMAAKWKSRQ